MRYKDQQNIGFCKTPAKSEPSILLYYRYKQQLKADIISYNKTDLIIVDLLSFGFQI